MGSDSEAYIFDDAVFREVVVPGLNDLVRTGVHASWLDDLLMQLRTAYRPTVLDLSAIEGRGFSFREICTYLDQDVAFEHRGAQQWSYTWHTRTPHGWADRACPSVTCPARQVCPLHKSAQFGVAEDFNRLFEASIVHQALGEGQFMGRSVTPIWYLDELATMGVRPESEVFDLLRRLALRGFVVGFGFCNSDGVHGWLYAEEARTLVKALEGLDLPQVEQSFAGMRSFFSPDTGYQAPGYSFERLSLAFLRTVASLAVKESKGILWGNDISAWWLNPSLRDGG